MCRGKQLCIVYCENYEVTTPSGEILPEKYNSLRIKGSYLRKKNKKSGRIKSQNQRMITRNKPQGAFHYFDDTDKSRFKCTYCQKIFK